MPLPVTCDSCGAEGPPAARFCSQCGTPFAVTASAAVPAHRRDRVDGQVRAERRQLTVLFCDLIGSTALSVEIDPEELREVLQEYQEACGQVIARYDGHIARYLGDGLLVYFGFPRAHEDDPRRAVHAALEIVEEVGRLNERLRLERDVRLALRLGIHTGLVVAGELGARQRPDPLAIVGDTPNIAARLQEEARPDTVVVSPTTARLIDGFFACQSLGPRVLKGLPEPLEIFEVLGSTGVVHRLEVAPSRLSPLVGRDAEMAQLLDRWERARSGQGQVVLLRGEPGIGKSRQAQALRELLDREKLASLELRCSAYRQDSAFYPVIDVLQRTLNLGPRDDPAEAVAHLEAALARAGLPLPEAVPLLAGLLSLPMDDRYPPLNLSPQRQRQRTLETLLTWLLTVAVREPTLFVVEDLHWVDPSTLELLTMLVEGEQSAPLLTLLTFRPEFEPPWAPRENLALIELNSLDTAEIVTLATHVAGGKSLPPEILVEVEARTDGVPLYVEELTKMVLESGLLREGDAGFTLAGRLQPLAIPDTIQDSLNARLDRLNTAKPVAQLGAALGREFRYELLREVSPLDDSSLQRELGRLIEAGLVYEGEPHPGATYLFKHALVQDAAYQSLLRSTRQQYHQRIAGVLQSRFPEIVEAEPELLAHHLSEAGVVIEAIKYWLLAGRRAVGRSAHTEAIGHLRRGLDLVATLPVSPERDQQELSLQSTLGLPLLMTRGYAADEVELVYARARELCEKLGDTPQLYPVLWGLWAFYLVRNEFKTSTQLGDQLLFLGAQQNDTGLQYEAHAAHGLNYYWQGHFATARQHFEQAISLYDPAQHQALAVIYGQDNAGVSLGHLSNLLWIQGYPEQADAAWRRGLDVSQFHPFTFSLCLAFAAIFYGLRRDPVRCQELAERCIAITSEHGFMLWLADGIIMRGWAVAYQGKGEAGLAQLKEGMALYASIGSLLWVTQQHAILADVHLLLGQIDAGLGAVEDGLALAERTGEGLFLAELLRLRGELFLKQTTPDAQGAESAFLEALQIARSQGARSFELRIAMSLHRLWAPRGRAAESEPMLRAAYAWFTEGFDTPDLQEAEQLLAVAL